MERIRRGAEIQRIEADGGGVARRDRRIWHEVAKMAAATVVLAACFITGISIWPQDSSGLQRNHAAVPHPGPLKPDMPATASREQLAEALFGSQAPHYADPPAAPSKEAVAASSATITPSSEPAAADDKATVASTETSASSSQAKAASIEAVTPGNETVVGSMPAA